jgi:superfamily I DNA/RNA helicase
LNFVIADTFTDSLARLTGDEQKAVKTTAFDLQMNPASPGLSFHKLDRAKDKSFWSVRAGTDLRLIVHRSEGSLLLCYVDHHDKAYAWAERRKLETHPTTGAAQLVEIRQRVQEIRIPKYVDVETPQPRTVARPFAAASDAMLLSYGVPTEWLGDVRAVSEDGLLDLCARLPDEAGEALLELVTGGAPRVPTTSATPTTPLTHPDAQRRFRVVSSVEELRRALDFPWDRWSVFLHPDQRSVVDQEFNGPARVSGSAGTGKTIVALHRAVALARRNEAARVLLTTFSDVLANSLRTGLRRLVAGEPRLAERIDVGSIGSVGARLYRSHVGELRVATQAEVAGAIDSAAAELGQPKFSPSFLAAEWDDVVDAWQLGTWEAYRDVARLGRRIRLSEAQRRALWGVFEKVQQTLTTHGRVTESGMFTRVSAALAKFPNPVYDFAVVDEAQDLGVAELRFLASLGRHHPDGLFFTGDVGQRIFQQPFSWVALGVDVRGRSRTLRVNYRTSHQIRVQADRLLDPKLSDADGNVEERRGTISVFEGAPPEIRTFTTADDETRAVADWLKARADEGLAPPEMGVFVRSEVEVPRAVVGLRAAGLSHRVLDEAVETVSGQVSIGTMHLAKGLEFRAVAVMACDDEVIPSQARISEVGDEGDLADAYETERHLLYVACTRARDHLLVTGVEPASEFLDDLRLAK